MNLNKFIYFGKFTLESCYVRSITGGYQGEIFLTLGVDTNNEEEEFLGVILQENEPRIDLLKIQKETSFISVSGDIYKNPSTHKTLYVIDNTNSIEII